MKKKVIAAGHICLDITPVFPEMKAESLDQVLSPGKLLQMDRADVHTGGAGANTALAMKKLGADVRLAGKIGKDAFGELILNILKKYDAQEGMTVSEGESTSYSVILAVPGIDRIFRVSAVNEIHVSERRAGTCETSAESKTCRNGGFPGYGRS